MLLGTGRVNADLNLVGGDRYRFLGWLQVGRAG